MTSSICSETTVSTGIIGGDNKKYHHQKRKTVEIQYLDIFEFLLNPLLIQITQELNSLSAVFQSSSLPPKTTTKDPYFISPFDFNIDMTKNPNDETVSISNESFIGLVKDNECQNINESLSEIEDSLLNNLICEKILNETSSNFNSSNININEQVEELQSKINYKDIISQVYHIIEKSVNIQKMMRQKNIDSSQLFRNSDRQYSIFNYKMKEIIVELSKTYDLQFLKRVFGISEKSIKRWSNNGTLRKKGAGRKEIDPQMGKKLYGWIISNRKKGIIFSRREIREKAKELSTVKSFLASEGWFSKFKKVYGIKTGRKNN